MKGRWPACMLALALAGPVVDVVAAAPVPGARVFASAGAPQAEGLSVESTRQSLAPISAAELLGGMPPRPTGRTAQATFAAGVLNVGGMLDPPPLMPTITRELQGVWRYAPGAKRNTAGIPRVRVELRSQSGRRGELSLQGDPAVSVPVMLRSRQELRRGIDGMPWYEGHVVLEIPVSALVAAGTYSGRIEISQESL